MKRWFVALALILSFVAGLDATKTTHVKGYTKKDGTHVTAHERKAKGESSTKTEKKDKKEKAASSSTKSASSTTCSTCGRDSHGKIKRDKHAVKNFQKATGYPKGRKGYVVDHIIPLACGGADAPYNMTWQTTADAKAKDKWERKGC